MNKRAASLWICLFGTVTIVVCCMRLVWHETFDSALTIGAGMKTDLMTGNGQTDFEQLAQSISEQTNTGEWQERGSSVDKTFRSIVTVCSADGCETFVVDGDGKLVPFPQSTEQLD